MVYMKLKLLGITDKNKFEENIKIVASAGKLSRYPGTVKEVYNKCDDYEKNLSYIKMILSLGHESIIDHDYLVFALEDVSPIVEQTLIKERFSSFTIKSRREVDFSQVGYVVPTFKDKNGNLLENQEKLQGIYKNYMDFLFDAYKKLLDKGIPKEDARFVLPYSYHSNIIMGFDAHVVKDLIVRFLKGKESKIDELKELGENMLEIVKSRASYLLDSIEQTEINQKIRKKLNEKILNTDYEIVDKVKLTSCTNDIDKQIFISAIMYNYQFSYEMAESIYEEKIKEDVNYQKELIKTINEDFDRLPLTQVNFNFQIPVSLAVLTHITRHRTHDILVPNFVPIGNLNYYLIPPTIKKTANEYFEEIFKTNVKVYEKFKNLGVRDEDLIYFYLSGNLVNIATNMDGKTLAWILRLRTCNKAQWEFRNIANQMKDLVGKVSTYFPEILGPDCVVKGYCSEGKESCGKIKTLKNQ